MAKKGKQKKKKGFHPFLVSGGVFLILLFVSATFWMFGGRKLFIPTTGVQRNFTEAKALYANSFIQIQDAKAAEDRMNSLVGKSGNKEIITTLTKQIDSDIALVTTDNTKLNLAVIALDQMTVPLSAALAKNHLSHGTGVITQWKGDAKKYYELAVAYALLISNISEYKDGVSSQSFDKQNSADAIASHQKLKDLCSEILTQTSKISDKTGEKFENVTAYFEKAKTYHEKNIFFYEADAKQDLTTQKLLVTDISNLKNELAKMDPISELQGFDASHLSGMRAKLDEQEKTIEHDYNVFKNKEL